MSREKMCVFAKRPVFTPALDFPEGPSRQRMAQRESWGQGTETLVPASDSTTHQRVAVCHIIGLVFPWRKQEKYLFFPLRSSCV